MLMFIIVLFINYWNESKGIHAGEFKGGCTTMINLETRQSPCWKSQTRFRGQNVKFYLENLLFQTIIFAECVGVQLKYHQGFIFTLQNSL